MRICDYCGDEIRETEPSFRVGGVGPIVNEGDTPDSISIDLHPECGKIFQPELKKIKGKRPPK